MNIRTNYNPSAFAGIVRGKLTEKLLSTAQAGENSAADTTESDSFAAESSRSEVTDAPSRMLPPIASASSAEEQVVFLKNAMLALPALVLRGQGNLVRQSVAQLLQ